MRVDTEARVLKWYNTIQKDQSVNERLMRRKEAKTVIIWKQSEYKTAKTKQASKFAKTK